LRNALKFVKFEFSIYDIKSSGGGGGGGSTHRFSQISTEKADAEQTLS